MNTQVPIHMRRMSKVAKSFTPEEAVSAAKGQARLDTAAAEARSNVSKQVENLRKTMKDSGRSAEEIEKAVNAIDTRKAKEYARRASANQKKLQLQREMAENPGQTRYLGLDKAQVQEKLKGKTGLTGEQLSKIKADKLTFGQNMRALGHELKGQSYTPKAVVKRGWENMGEGGGGWKGGTGWGRYNVLGAKGMTGIFAAGDLKDAANKTDTTGQGRSRTERLGYAAGGALGSVVGTLGAKRIARIGGVPGMLAAAAGGIGGMMGGYYLGGKAGKVVDKGVSNLRGVEAGDYRQALLAKAQRAYDKNQKNRGY